MEVLYQHTNMSIKGGFIMDYTVRCTWDPEAEVWWSECDELPVALEGETLDALIKEVMLAAPEMAELNKLPHPNRLLFVTGIREEVCV